MHPLRAVLDLPRGLQRSALATLRATVAVPDDEAWNTRFGPESLYTAWSGTRLMSGLYAANRRALAPVVAVPGFRVLELGGGNGRLWSGLLGEGHRGELHVVDPVPEVHDHLRALLPEGVVLVSHVARAEHVPLPEADAAVASLILHHVPGADAAERARHGLDGVGKVELLRRLRDAVAPRDGFVLVNEADVYCDLGLAPGDPVLAERLLDSYVRRCARALLDELPGHDPRTARRLEAIVWRWCVDQVGVAEVPRADRDVYELDVSRWREVFARAGLRVAEEGFTDDHGLFCRYLLRPA